MVCYDIYYVIGSQRVNEVGGEILFCSKLVFVIPEHVQIGLKNFFPESGSLTRWLPRVFWKSENLAHFFEKISNLWTQIALYFKRNIFSLENKTCWKFSVNAF